MLQKTIIIAGLMGLTSAAFAAPIQPDNTQVNQRDYQTGTLTAEDQARGSAADVELTRKIRQDLVADKSLSTDAQNIKIVTLNSVVTLRGPVATPAERQKIDALVKKTAGVSRVDNQLEIKSR